MSARSTTKNEFTVIDLFAGCGGLSLGLERAGFRPVFVSELNDHALDTYLMNRQHLSLKRNVDSCNDIALLTRRPHELEALANRMHRKWGEITLVAGGPPCQGYSSRGIRSTFRNFERHETPSNHLYKEMARFIAAVEPQLFLFENVAGLRTAKWTRDGVPGEIFDDVMKTFNALRSKRNNLSYLIQPYVIRCADYGVPQNRPRLFIVGVRQDVPFNPSLSGLEKGLFPQPDGRRPPDPVDLIGDLVDVEGERRGKTVRYPRDAKSPVQIELRRSNTSRRVSRKGAAVTEHEYTDHSPHVVERFTQLIRNPHGLDDSMKIKKFSQKALPKRWGPKGPSITATSAPDDYVHYSRPRILTVREWARLQTFPDWYQFCGPRTTGGRRRAGDPQLGIWDRELPKYTQIGNAVPVVLAEQIGRHFRAMLTNLI